MRRLRFTNYPFWEIAVITRKDIALLTAFISLAPFGAHAATVTPTNEAGALAADLLGTGVTLVGTPTLTGPAGSTGSFIDGLAAGLGFDSGILLSTGFAAEAAGPNTLPDAGDGLSLIHISEPTRPY